MSEFNLKSGNTTPFKMMGSSPLHAESKLVSKANKPSEEKPNDPYAYEHLTPEKIEELRSHFEKPDLKELKYPLTPAEPVSTSVTKPIVPIVEKEEEPSGVPPGFFSETGLMKKSMRKIPKKKKNILQSFTDFLTSKIDKKQSLIR